jgi:NTE family protein
MTEREKRALVLGCGGVLGAAWTIATLAELERVLGWDARSADVLVGTSAGAVLAALLGAGVSVEHLLKSQLGEIVDECWNHDSDLGSAPARRPSLRLGAPGLVLQALRGRVHPVAAVAGALPRGRGSLAALERLIDAVVPPGAWSPHPATYIVVLDAGTGERVLLGREGAPRPPLSTAVCASFAIPGRYPPVAVNGARYLDAGIVSPASADLVIGMDVREVIVLAPMASRDRRLARSAFSVAGALRRYMTAVVDREVLALRHAGLRVVRLEPGAEDVAAMGGDMMDVTRRRRVLDTARRTARATLAATGSRDALA